MGNSSSVEDGSGLASPNILSKVTVKGSKADMDAFLTEGRVNNVQIAYVTKKQVWENDLFVFALNTAHYTNPLVSFNLYFRSSLCWSPNHMQCRPWFVAPQIACGSRRLSLSLTVLTSVLLFSDFR